MEMHQRSQKAGYLEQERLWLKKSILEWLALMHLLHTKLDRCDGVRVAAALLILLSDHVMLVLFSSAKVMSVWID